MQIVHKSESINQNNDVVSRAMNSVLQTAYLYRKQQEKILERFGLTSSRWEVLQIVHRAQPDTLSQKDIREMMMDKTIDLPRLIQQMQKDGTLSQERSPLNKRVSQIGITAAGIELFNQIQRFFEEKNLPSVNISPDEASFIHNTLQKLAVSLRF